MKRKTKRIMAGLLALVLTMAPISQSIGKATAEVKYDRIAGNNRYTTSVAASKFSVNKSSKVVIANGNSFADTLSGGNLVNEWGAPILLVSKDHVSSEVKAEINRIGAKDIYLLGGENTVSKAVEKELSKLGRVHRVAGSNRYDTSKKVLALLPKRDIGVASGENFADALAAGPFLRVNKAHLLLVHPGTNNSGIKAQYVFGGPKSVPGFSGIKRLAGKNRYETALEITNQTKAKGIVLVNGDQFADALSAAIVSQAHDMAILLTGPNAQAAGTYFEKNFVEQIVVVGGNNTLSDNRIAVTLKDAIGVPPHFAEMVEKLKNQDQTNNTAPSTPDEKPAEKAETFEAVLKSEEIRAEVGDKINVYSQFILTDKATKADIPESKVTIVPSLIQVSEKGTKEHEVEISYKGFSKKFTIKVVVSETAAEPTFNLRVNNSKITVKKGDKYQSSKIFLLTDKDSGWAISKDQVAFEPAYIEPTRAGTSYQQEIKITYKGYTQKETIEVNVPKEAPVFNTNMGNLNWIKKQDSIYFDRYTAVHDSIKTYLKAIHGANANFSQKLMDDAKALGRVQAETDVYMPFGHFPVFDGYRVIGYKRVGGPGYSIEMGPLALDYSLDEGLDLSKVKEYGVAIHTSGNQIYGLVIVPEAQVSKGLSSRTITNPIRGSWETLSDGRKIAQASQEVEALILKGYNDSAKSSVFTGTKGFWDNDPAIKAIALANAKRNAINKGLKHDSIGYGESLGIIIKNTEIGLRSYGNVLLHHNGSLSNVENQAIGAYAVQETNGSIKYYVSLFGR